MQDGTGINKTTFSSPSTANHEIPEQSAADQTRQQTATGAGPQDDAPPLKNRHIGNTEPASHVSPKKAEISSLEKQYKGHCTRKAKLEERKEVSQQLETIRKFMAAPKDFDKDCGFAITFVSRSGKEISVLPPDEKLDEKRLGKLLGKLELLVGKPGETEESGELEKAFGKGGKKLDESLEEIQEEINTTYTELKELAPNSEALKYTPEKIRKYELTAALPDWRPSDDLEAGSFVIKFDSQGSNPKPSQPETRATTPRTILKPDSSEEELTSEPDILELPGIKNIRPLRSDAPLFLPRGDKSQEATATIISGDADSEFALPKALTSTFEDEDGNKFQALHSTLLNRVKDTGAMPDADLRKIAPACIRQCFCDKTGTMGTTFIHVFAENHTQSPYSSENRHNKVMVLWYPNKGLQITPESLQQANMEVMSALSRYQRKAFIYNDRPLDEEGPGLERDFATYSQSKEHSELTKSAPLITNTRTGKKRKLKTKDPREPSAYPVVTALRVGELPHEALLKRSPTTEEDNRALLGFRSALRDLPENRRFLKSLELPERFFPKEEGAKPSELDKSKLSKQGSTEGVSTPLMDVDDDLDAVLDKEQEQIQLTTPPSDGLIPDKGAIPLNEDDDIDTVIEHEQTKQTVPTTLSDKGTDPLPEEDDLDAELKLRNTEGHDLFTDVGMTKLQVQEDGLRTQDNRQFSEIKTEAPEETVQPDISGLLKTQAQQDLKEHRDTLQLFDESTAQSILPHSKSSLQPNGPRAGMQPPAHTTIQRYQMIPQTEGSKDVAQLLLYVEGSTSNSESVQQSTDQFSERLENSLTAYMEKNGSLEGISDSTVINMIYAALPSPGDPSLEQAADFRIFLGINSSFWLLNRRDSGDMRTLCIPHDNPEIREIHADNTDPAIAERLAKAIYKTDQVTEEQLTETKRLPAISKLPALEDRGYYLLMERTALNELMTEQDILEFINSRHGDTPEDITAALRQELTERWGGNPEDVHQAGFEIFNFSPR